MNAIQEKMDSIRLKMTEYKQQFIIAALFVLSSVPASAQSVSIALAPEDLDIFFIWFNIMFTVIIPIALLGAGLVAGAKFAFVVGNMLKKAFESMLAG